MKSLHEKEQYEVRVIENNNDIGGPYYLLFEESFLTYEEAIDEINALYGEELNDGEPLPFKERLVVAKVLVTYFEI